MHVLDHMVEDINRLGRITFRDASTIEHFNLVIKKSYRAKLLRDGATMYETVRNIGRVMKRGSIAVETARSTGGY